MTDIDCLYIKPRTTSFDRPNTNIVDRATAGNATMRIGSWLRAYLTTPEGCPLNPCLECRFGTEFRSKVAYAIFKKGEVRILMHVHS